MSCPHPEHAIDEDERQLNEDERQITRTCLLCGTVISIEIKVVRQW